jgi:hypothetical protein
MPFWDDQETLEPTGDLLGKPESGITPETSAFESVPADPGLGSPIMSIIQQWRKK